MGIFLSYQSEESSPLEECVDSLLTKSFGSGKFIIEGSLSFKRKQENDLIHVETEVSIKSPRYDAENAIKPLTSSKSRFSPSEIDPESPKHEAAVKLQKVYKSFRTRRQLADCAVLVDQHWWKVLDFALLKRSSVSFFDIDKPESVVSKWSRARTRAAKVGKGLSKDENAKKLALQHWLEAIDPRHRYGHNLHYYYDCWLHCDSKQPFFYWLDVGEGKEVNLEKCPRLQLQQQCIKYLGPKEREAYEVIVENGKLIYKQSQELIDTSEGSKNDKWIFVLSTSKALYVGQKKKGKFQHSSFLAGGATSAAGRLVVENGILKAVWPHSGHYRPTEENFQEFMSFLKENNVDLTDVKLSPSEDDDEENSDRLKSFKSELNMAGIEQEEEEEKQKQEETEIPTNITETDLEEENILPFEEENILTCEEENILTCEEEKQGENTEEQVVVPKATILHRINSKKGLKSYQLGKQLSLKWSTGAGPRIGFVRDYPSEIQIRALEEVSLSPRCTGNSKFFSSPSSL